MDEANAKPENVNEGQETKAEVLDKPTKVAGLIVKISRISFIFGATCLVVSLVGMDFFSLIVHKVLGFSMFAFFFLTFVSSMVSRVILFRRKKIKGSYCAIAAVIFFLLAFVSGSSVFIGLLFSNIFLILAIIVHVISLRSKVEKYFKKWSGGAILVLSIPLVFLAPSLVRVGVPYIYMPPALTPEAFQIYTRCVEFMKRHGQYTELGLTEDGRVSIKTHFDNVNDINTKAFLLGMRGHITPEELVNFFSREEIIEIERLSKEISKVNCYWVQRQDDVVFFVKWKEGLFGPIRAGVLYSIDGRNPNEIGIDILNINKPFIKISGNWYMSKKLFVPVYRLPFGDPVPNKSLIDHSLRIEGIDFGGG